MHLYAHQTDRLVFERIMVDSCGVLGLLSLRDQARPKRARIGTLRSDRVGRMTRPFEHRRGQHATDARQYRYCEAVKRPTGLPWLAKKRRSQAWLQVKLLPRRGLHQSAVSVAREDLSLENSRFMHAAFPRAMLSKAGNSVLMGGSARFQWSTSGAVSRKFTAQGVASLKTSAAETNWSECG